MYPHTRYPGGVRDRRARYGEQPDPGEHAPERVLRDLAGAPEEEFGTIIARFAALRAWLLSAAGAPPAVIEHARSAAAEHIAAAGTRWREGSLLSGLRGPDAEDRLVRAAAEAEAAGHVHGARALLGAAERAGRTDGWTGCG